MNINKIYEINKELNKEIITTDYYINKTGLEVFQEIQNQLQQFNVFEVINILDDIELLEDLSINVTTYLENELINKLNYYKSLYPQYVNYIETLLGYETFQYQNELLYQKLQMYDERLTIEDYYDEYIDSEYTFQELYLMNIDFTKLTYKTKLTNDIIEHINNYYYIDTDIENYIDYSQLIKDDENIIELTDDIYMITEEL